MITRSGTNQFHGSIAHNFQHDVFSSRDPFLPSTTRKPEILFNQFGGSLGGPILQKRTQNVEQEHGTLCLRVT